ncbi:MAG: efflux RND transporter permease subunit [Gammaproteobacteria bacterium]|nr:efflux RND transporter permease subunit [Gammaproteobacteria bacterium]MCP5137653.1 efflux RND transporter permease subunit [Gammaproteobacteria bacterium]
MTFTHRQDIVGLFAQHKVAANLLMVIMLLSGLFALSRLNTQFFPNFELEVITVRVVWAGAAAEDVERSVTIPLEQNLRTVDGLDKLSSTSSQGISAIVLEFPEGTDMGQALNRVEERVTSVRNLPTDSEEPVVSHAARYDVIARVLIYGPQDRSELRHLARQFERELLDRGIAKVDLAGLPDEEMAIQIPQATLDSLGLSLQDVARRVSAESNDLPAGTVGRDDVGRQLRALLQRRSETGFEDIALIADQKGRLVRLGDVATIERRARPNQAEVFHDGQPAVELTAYRSENGDSLESARILAEWAEQAALVQPPNVHIKVYDEQWTLIRDRINLLLKNGLGGLVLVVAILFLFLNARVAWWVTLGIPISFMATIAVIYLIGGSINMISLFALIMALGIIVDDAIVVGEDSLTHYQTGESSLEAAEGGARRMLAPVLSSSLTTIAAFIPLLLVSGIIGKILNDIPVVIICVIIASLIESFLVLPGHLRHSFLTMHHAKPSRMRARLENGFNHFRDRQFRPALQFAVDHRALTVALALACMIGVVGLVKGGRLGFTFFPSVEGNIVLANATFVAGTPPQRVEAFIEGVEKALYDAETELGGNLVRASVVSRGSATFSGSHSAQQGDQFASITAELVPSDTRSVRNEELLRTWEAHVRKAPGLESLTMTSRRGGPPGRDVEVRLTGANATALKAAGLELVDMLKTIEGVSGIEDDMPFGQQQLLFDLTPQGEAIGLTVAEVGRQLRDAYDGNLAQIFNQGDEEVEVRVMLPDLERHRLSSLEDFQVRLPGGGSAPLSAVADLKERRGFEALRHAEGKLALTVFGDVDRDRNNADRIREQLAAKVLPDLVAKHGIDWEFTGKAEDQRETVGDMRRGALFALAMIYIVLAWVFGSYGWPLVVMAIIPFGIVGAIFGHWVMGIELTILSMFGLFGLSGIVVNDSIILVVFYKQLREQGLGVKEAVVEAACQRLRAVLLTSLTTIAGLSPLLFETSFQAQFLIPMATSIAFGLAFATFLVLFIVPTLLSLMEQSKFAIATRLPFTSTDENAP